MRRRNQQGKAGAPKSIRLDDQMKRDLQFVTDHLKLRYDGWSVTRTTAIAYALRDCAAALRIEDSFRQRKAQGLPTK